MHAVLTVSQLTAQIKGVVEELFGNIYVAGEISNAKAYPSGHWYFSLKDKDSTIPCVCFRSANANIKFKLEDGLMVVLQGNLSIYPPKGAYQLVANTIEPVGVGEWQLAFEQLKAALEKEGLLDPARKRPIPTMPRRVGVVTSTAAAALRDILSALSRRNRHVNVVISPTRVQGEGSPEEIAQAIRDLQEVPGIDVIIVARGGGSIEDLWSFNTDVVARAVAASAIPIVSGVGHETDVTICDLVADLRAPTPTAAAELVAKGTWELIEKYKNYQQQLIFKVDQRVMRASRALERLNPLNALARYQGRLKQYDLRVVHHKAAMDRRISHLIRDLEHRWQKRHEQLLALAPTNVLKRGFAIVRKLDGTVVCDADSVEVGDELQAILRSGSLTLKVEKIASRHAFGYQSRNDQEAMLGGALPIPAKIFAISGSTASASALGESEVSLNIFSAQPPNQDTKHDTHQQAYNEAYIEPTLVSQLFDGSILDDTSAAEMELRESVRDAEYIKRLNDPLYQTRGDGARQDGALSVGETWLEAVNEIVSDSRPTLESDLSVKYALGIREMMPVQEMGQSESDFLPSTLPASSLAVSREPLISLGHEGESEIEPENPLFLPLANPGVPPMPAGHRPTGSARRPKRAALAVSAQQLNLFGSVDEPR
jgi:exodeoxyribonuclease VII large subunit